MLVDIFMPDMRGFEAIQIFREPTPIIPMIGVSAACPAERDGMPIFAADAHGYGEVAQHPESIFSAVAIGGDLIAPCGGRLDLPPSSGQCALVEILLSEARDG